MAHWLRLSLRLLPVSAVGRALSVLLLGCCLTQARVALADVWAYVDEKGIAHFATTQLDPRYSLFARVDDTPAPQTSKAPAPSPVGLSANSRDTASAQQKKLLAMFEKSPDYAIVQTLLREASRRHDVSYELLQAVMATESGFSRYAVSPKGAVGLMQIMPATAQRFGLKPLASASVEKRLFDPAVNIDTGARYLRYLTSLFPGEAALALAAYNAGEGAVQRAGNRIPNYPETQQYVKTVMQLQQLLRGPTTGSGLDPAKLVPPAAPSMMVPGQVLGRSNMVQDLGSRSGRITFQIPAEPTNDALEK